MNDERNPSTLGRVLSLVYDWERLRSRDAKAVAAITCVTVALAIWLFHDMAREFAAERHVFDSAARAMQRDSPSPERTEP